MWYERESVKYIYKRIWYEFFIGIFVKENLNDTVLIDRIYIGNSFGNFDNN